jgi:hypothetical protein
MSRQKPTRHRAVAKVMCEAATRILYEGTRDWLEKQRPGVSFAARVGQGKATYCRVEGSGTHFVLNFGPGMVADKLAGTQAIAWTTSREISDRGYLGGRITPLNLFAQTVLHEYAHVVDYLRRADGRALDGRVHGGGFYRVLDRMHAGHVADQVRDFIARESLQRGLPTVFDDGRAELDASMREMAVSFRPGMRVVFDDRGRGITASWSASTASRSP